MTIDIERLRQAANNTASSGTDSSSAVNNNKGKNVFSTNKSAANTAEVSVSSILSQENEDEDFIRSLYDEESKSKESDETSLRKYDENGCIYNENDQLLSERIIYPNGAEVIADYTYDENGNKSHVQMLLNGVLYCDSDYFYDENGKLKSSNSYYYDSNEEIESKTVELYDENGNATERTRFTPDGKITNHSQMEYDENNNIVSETGTFYDEDGNETDHFIELYDENGNATERTHFTPDGKITNHSQMEYDENNNIVSETGTFYDEDGNETDHFIELYDERGNATEITHFDKNGEITCLSQIEYNEEGNIVLEKNTHYNSYYIDEKIINFDSQNNPTTKYERIIDNQGNIQFEFQYEFDFENNNWKELYIPDYNQEINYTMQGEIGDCWLLSGINNLSYCEAGRELIKNCVSYNEDGSFSVYFKGIDTTINITEEEVQYARESGVYSKGDNDMLIFELAFESALNKIQNGEIKLDNNHPNLTVRERSDEEEYSIDGGYLEDVIFMLTGQDTIRTTSNFKEYDFIFDQIENNRENNIASISIYSQQNGFMQDIYGNNIYNLNSDNAHAFAIKSVDGDIVTIVNPWNSGIEYKVSRETIKEYAREIEYYNFDHDVENLEVPLETTADSEHSRVGTGYKYETEILELYDMYNTTTDSTERMVINYKIQEILTKHEEEMYISRQQEIQKEYEEAIANAQTDSEHNRIMAEYEYKREIAELYDRLNQEDDSVQRQFLNDYIQALTLQYETELEVIERE